MDNYAREANYRRQRGGADLTPRQRKRLRLKRGKK